MGAQCCTDENVKRDTISKLENDIMVPISNNEYYIHEWPIQEEIELQIKELKQSTEFREVFQKHKMMKHKFYDKYYVGEWSQEGYPDGKGVLYVPDYFLYYGHFDRVPNGHGVVELFREKIRYEGELRDGKAEGQGKIKSHDGRYSFEGIMHESNPRSGKIILNNPNDESKSHTIIIDNFPQGRSQIQYADGRKYTGYIDKKSFAPHGEGVAVFPDTSSYDGHWEQGEMHGQGYFSWNDGSSYRGEYQHGRKHGIGRFLFPSGKYYEGEWVHGKQSGSGTLYDKNGDIVHKGTWKQGVFLKESE